MDVLNGLPATVTRRESDSGLVFLDVNHPLAQASLCLQGAHLVSYQASGSEPLLWVSEAESYQIGQAIRGGIPICWPWFGAHPSVPQASAHGFVRTTNWTLENVSSDAAAVVLRLTYLAHSQPHWPFCAALCLVITVGATLRLELTTTNTGTDAFNLTQALHTYFDIRDIQQVSLAGIGTAAYDDSVLGEYFPSAAESLGDLRFEREVDRIYYPTESLVLKAGQRRIGITVQGSNSTVVWNPWVAKSARLSHFKPDDYLRMVCVEAANAGRDSIALKARASHTLGVTYQQLPTGKS